MTKVTREYLSVAERKGFFLVEIQEQLGKHLRLTMRGPKNVVFNSTLPKTPSDRRGALNWVSSLKQQENIAAAREEPMQSDKHEIESIIIAAGYDPELFFLRYTPPNSNQKWFCNKTGKVNKGDIKKSTGDFLLKEELIEKVESPEQYKEIFTLTKKGYGYYSNLVAKSVIEDEEEKGFDLVAKTASEEKISKPTTPEQEAELQAAFGEPVISDRDNLILMALKQFSHEDIKKILFYGVEFLKDDLNRELIKITKAHEAATEILDQLR